MPDLATVSQPTTVATAIREATRRLAAVGIEGAGRDARLLVAAVAGIDEKALIMQPDLPMAVVAAQRLSAMIERRARNEPVSRILGYREFYGRRFEVTPATLDPRPDSETLIEAALDVVEAEGWRNRELRIIDIGTGTGCLLLTLLAELPLSRGVGTDVSSAALDVAVRNAVSLGLADRAIFRRGRSLEPACDKFDILISNPPYIPTGELEGLPSDVRYFDPRLALDGGRDGLDIYREIATPLVEVVPEGWALFEVGAGQSSRVGEILAGAVEGGHAVKVWRDIDGRERCVAIPTHR